MSAKSPSTLVCEFIEALIAAAGTGAALENAVLVDNPFGKITGDKGIVISSAEFDLTPMNDGTVRIDDGLVVIAPYVRVPGPSKEERAAKRDICFQIAEAIAAALYADPTMGNRFCDSAPGRQTDGFRNTTADSYAVINLPVTLNPTGGPIDFSLGEAQ